MQGRAEWGSDVIVDMMKAYGIDFAFSNLGGSFRGLLDSIINYGGNQAPEVIECLHEEVAVCMAHGYAIATERPSVALVHNVVGTLHGSMGIYDTYVGHGPVIVMSGTGPMRLEQRRGAVDWQHTALVQGNLVRDYVKWDDQPVEAEGFPESFMRAYQVTATEPMGPTYIALDAGWQEERLSQPFALPDVAKYAPPTPVGGSPAALRRLAELLANAELPIIVAGRVGRKRAAVSLLVDLADAGAIPVVDAGGPFNFPNTHALDATGTSLIDEADVVLLLDVDYPEQQLTHPSGRYPRRGGRNRVRPEAKVINLRANELFIRSTTLDFGQLNPFEMTIAADSGEALPELTALLRMELEGNAQAGELLERRRARVAEAQSGVRARWQGELQHALAERPISHARLIQETWKVIEGEKWVVAGARDPWFRRLWQMDRPGCMGGTGGAAAVGTNLPKSIGVALAAARDGGFCVAFNGDGDLLYNPSALWTPVHHHIPMLLFVFDNGGYQGEGGHVRYANEQRERSTDQSYIAVDIQRPRIDIASLARSQGAYAEGPIEDPDELGPAIQRALKIMKEERTLAVVVVRSE